MQNEREWQAFCREVLRRPELAADERDAGNHRSDAARAEVQALDREAVAPLTAAEVVARHDDAASAYSRAPADGGRGLPRPAPARQPAHAPVDGRSRRHPP